MAQAPAHPLLSLPDDEIIPKLRKMSIKEILKFSLISERCKDLVKSVEMEGISLRISVQNKITITIEIASSDLVFHYYTEPDIYWGMGAYGRKKRLTEPQSVLVDVTIYDDESDDLGYYDDETRFEDPKESEKANFELEKRDFSMPNWLDHLQQIFDYPKIDLILFSTNSSEFDIDDIKEVFRNALEIRIEDTGCYDFNQLILQKFSLIETLVIKTSNFQNSKIPNNILMGNFTHLHIHDSEEGTTYIELNDMLLINSKEIFIDCFHMPAQQLNKFLKLWQKGSNPRMEYLAIYYLGENELDNEIMMKGIKHRSFRGGADIVRIDGVKATIRIKERAFCAVEMYVLFDHCVEE